MNLGDDDLLLIEELLILFKFVIFRLKLLLNIVLMFGEKLVENMIFYEDMKRCRYLRIFDILLLSIE